MAVSVICCQFHGALPLNLPGAQPQTPTVALQICPIFVSNKLWTPDLVNE